MKRIQTVALALVATLISMGPSDAEVKKKMVAGWFVSIDKDPFGSDDRIIVAKDVSGGAIGFRCFSKKPQIAIIEGNAFKSGSFKKGEYYQIKARIDENTVSTGIGVAVSRDLLQVELIGDDVYRQAAGGRELAVRVEEGGNYALYRLDLRGASKALPEFYASCGLSPR